MGGTRWLTMSDKPIPGSYWVLPDRFLAGAYPVLQFDEVQTRQHIAHFLEAGFDTFIDLTNLNERLPYDPILDEEAGRYGLKVHHRRIPFPDFHAPTRRSMTAALDAIDTALAEDHKVYLHCVGGIGRTGTTVGCWLIRHGMDGSAALKRLQELYSDSAQSALARNSPEGDEQIEFILNWVEHGLA
jgi:predicted protein tyrosine phosphatase